VLPSAELGGLRGLALRGQAARHARCRLGRGRICVVGILVRSLERETPRRPVARGGDGRPADELGRQDRTSATCMEGAS
jgi:hypothetical protein